MGKCLFFDDLGTTPLFLEKPESQHIAGETGEPQLVYSNSTMVLWVGVVGVLTHPLSSTGL